MSRHRAARRAVVAMLGAALACPSLAAEPPIALRLPPGADVQWHGAIDAEVGKPGTQMLYPAPGPLGFLVAIATHAAIVGGARKVAGSRQQTEADLVLEPYRGILATWTAQSLNQASAAALSPRAARALAPDAGPAADEWLVESAPTFALSQDHDTVLLDNSLRIIRPGSATPGFEGVVRVISTPLPGAAERAAARAAHPAASASADSASAPPAAFAAAASPALAGPASAASAATDPAGTMTARTTPSAAQANGAQAQWSADDGARLKRETAAMLAHSIDIALAQAAASASDPAAAPPFRTHRYLMGGNESMERAQLLASGCNRIVLRTLRGTLLSAPVRTALDTPRCSAPYRIGG